MGLSTKRCLAAENLKKHLNGGLFGRAPSRALRRLAALAHSVSLVAALAVGPGACSREEGGAAPPKTSEAASVATAAAAGAGAGTNAAPERPEHLRSASTSTPGGEASPPAPASSESAAPAAPAEEVLPVRSPTSFQSEEKNGVVRMKEARDMKLEEVKGLFASAGVAFPPGQLLLRGFKREKRVEMWAASKANGALSHVATYGMCLISGELGPKRKEGDLQVPEGFYVVNFYNPSTPYYLGMQINYPNKSDRILGDKLKPGSEIMIHGSCASIGCISMSDERMAEIWVAVSALRSTGGTIHVHIFPARDMAGLLRSKEYEQHWGFWGNIKEGLDYFEAHKKIPVVTVDKDGRYAFR